MTNAPEIYSIVDWGWQKRMDFIRRSDVVAG